MAPDDKLMLPLHGRPLLRHMAKRVLEVSVPTLCGSAARAAPKMASRERLAFAQDKLPRQRRRTVRHPARGRGRSPPDGHTSLRGSGRFTGACPGRFCAAL